MFRIPGQDIDLPDNLPNEGDIADGGSTVIDFLLTWPTLIGAVIVAFLLKKAWENVGMRIAMVAVLAVLITLWLTNQ